METRDAVSRRQTKVPLLIAMRKGPDYGNSNPEALTMALLRTGRQRLSRRSQASCRVPKRRWTAPVRIESLRVGGRAIAQC